MQLAFCYFNVENLGHCPDSANYWVEYLCHKILVPFIDCDNIEGSRGVAFGPQGHVGSWDSLGNFFFGGGMSLILQNSLFPTGEVGFGWGLVDCPTRCWGWGGGSWGS